jgi:HPt (histidine-containing phosphotransfer) domain-containing protein
MMQRPGFGIRDLGFVRLGLGTRDSGSARSGFGRSGFGGQDSGFGRSRRGMCATGVAAWGFVAALAFTGACAPAPQTKNTPAAGTSLTRDIVDPYLQIQTALADDKTDGVKAHAGEIATAATALGAPAMKIDTAALQLASATELADAREKFGTLSEAIDTYMTGLHLTPPDGVKVAYCPMVNKPWLQQGDTIDNPYYGKEMPTCGNFK